MTFLIYVKHQNRQLNRNEGSIVYIISVSFSLTTPDIFPWQSWLSMIWFVYQAGNLRYVFGCRLYQKICLIQFVRIRILTRMQHPSLKRQSISMTNLENNWSVKAMYWMCLPLHSTRFVIVNMNCIIVCVFELQFSALRRKQIWEIHVKPKGVAAFNFQPLWLIYYLVFLKWCLFWVTFENCFLKSRGIWNWQKIRCLFVLGFE